MSKTIVTSRLGVLIMLVAECVACAQSSPAPRFNLSGYSPEFRQGHADGCASAGGAMRRDERRFRKDMDYMMGWNDGHSACGN